MGVAWSMCFRSCEIEVREETREDGGCLLVGVEEDGEI